jgi:tetratricopeptide (TPR) repeat protein
MVKSQTEKNEAMDYYHKAMDKVKIKDYTGAINNFNEAIKLDTGFLEAYENRGVTKYYLEDIEGAIEDYDKALKINPDDGNTYVRRGWAKFALKEFNEALADFTRAIDTGINDPLYHKVRGEVKYKLHDYTGAISDLNFVIDTWYSGKKLKSEAYFWRGLVKIDMGQKEIGCQDLKKAAKLGYEKAEEIKRVYCE